MQHPRPERDREREGERERESVGERERERGKEREKITCDATLFRISRTWYEKMQNDRPAVIASDCRPADRGFESHQSHSGSFQPGPGQPGLAKSLSISLPVKSSHDQDWPNLSLFLSPPTFLTETNLLNCPWPGSAGRLGTKWTTHVMKWTTSALLVSII